MLKTTKPGRYYILVNLDEPYAQDVYEVLKYGQTKKVEDGESDAWPEGDIDFVEWARQTFAPLPPRNYEEALLAMKASMYRFGNDPLERGYASTHPREFYSLLAEKDAEIERLREALEAIARRGPVFDAKGTHSAETARIALDALTLEVKT